MDRDISECHFRAQQHAPQRHKAHVRSTSTPLVPRIASCRWQCRSQYDSQLDAIEPSPSPMGAIKAPAASMRLVDPGCIRKLPRAQLP